MSVMSPRHIDPTLQRLKAQASRIFNESRDAMRQSMVLHIKGQRLRRAFDAHELLERNRKPDVEPMVYGSVLTPRERTVLQLIVAGKTTRQIATELGIAFKTAACHRSSAMGKLDVNNTAALVREAIRLGLVKEE